MAEFEYDQDFNSEQVQKIAENALQAVIGSNNLTYNREKVNQWTS